MRLQAAYFLSLLADPDIEPRVAQARREVAIGRTSSFAWRGVTAAWALGPFDAAMAKSARPEDGPIDLSAEYATAGGKFSWRSSPARQGMLAAVGDLPGDESSASYFHFQLQSATPQHALLDIAGARDTRLWHNGQPATSANRQWLLALQPGGNDLLIRAADARDGLRVRFRASQGVTDRLPERIDSGLLAERLRQAAAGGEVPAALLEIEWSGPIEGDAARGRQLFSSIGCAKCHGITLEQPGGGAPNLADARRRFTAAYLVESVLLPSKQIAEPFRSTVLSLENGTVVTGLVVNETADAVELLLPDATRRRIATDEIEERGVGRQSPMPSGLLKTPQELRDLLAYLLSDRPSPP
jgi:putative heme-binding domain-containing protein